MKQPSKSRAAGEPMVYCATMTNSSEETFIRVGMKRALWRAIKRAAADRDVSGSALIRQVMTKWVDENEGTTGKATL